MADPNQIASSKASGDNRKTPDENRNPEGGIKTDVLMDISPAGGGGDKREASPEKTSEGSKKFHPEVDQKAKPEQPQVKEKTPDLPAENLEKKKTPERPAVDENKSPAGDKISPAEEKKSPVVTPADDKKTPASPADENKKPKDPAEKPVYGLRPNQDNTFDDEHFEVKMYAHETDKDKDVQGAVVEPKTDNKDGVAGTIVTKSEPTPSSGGVRQINVDVVKDDEEEEEEEEEEENDSSKIKVIPKTVPIVEGSKQKLDRESSSFDEDDTLFDEADQALSPEEKKVLIDTKPVVEGFLASYHQIIERETPVEAALTTDGFSQTDRTPSPCIPLFHQQPLSPAAQTGQKLSQVAIQFDAEYRPIVNDLVKQWLQELKRLNDGQQPAIKSVWESFRKIVQEVFRDGYSWSKIIILLMFVFEVVVHLYTSYVPKTVQQFIRWFLKFLVSAGITNWVARQGGWAVGTIGVVQEHSHMTTSALTGTIRGGCPVDAIQSPMVLMAAAGVALLAGAAYLFFKKN